MNENNPFLQDNTPTSVRNKILDIVQILVVIFAILAVLYLFVFTPSEVDGPSMNETLHDGQLMITNKYVQILGGKGVISDYKRGDVIIFKSKAAGEDTVVKRIIGIEGDVVRIEKGKVYVNGKIIDEPYLSNGITTSGGSFLDSDRDLTVPAKSYFVLGDNRPASKDSRSKEIGFVKRTDIVGRVVFRFWPLNKIGFISGHDYGKI